MRPTDNNRPFLDTWPEHLVAAKIKRPIRWYDLRHTCASSLVSGWWTDAHWTLEMVQAYLGHNSRLSTERYAHLGELAMTQAARGDRRVTLRRVTNASAQLAQISNSDTQPVDIVLVGRPGLEPGTYGLKRRSSPLKSRKVVKTLSQRPTPSRPVLSRVAIPWQCRGRLGHA